MEARTKEFAVAYAVAATLSGAPSTLAALVHGDPLLDAPRAAATVLPGRRGRPGLVAGVVAHLLISAAWSAVLVAPLRRLRRPQAIVAGAAAGLGIAALDLGLAARRYPAIRALRQPPQWADHVAFGALVGWAVGLRDDVDRRCPGK